MNNQQKIFVLSGIIFFLEIASIFAQTPLYFRRYYRPGTTEREQMVALYYPLTSTTLNLTDFRERYPQHKNFVPQEVTIKLPNLEDLKDVVYSICYLEIPGEVEGILMITIIGNYFSDEPVHFFDFNLDRNFTNDKNNRYIFSSKTEIQPFTFTKSGLHFRKYTLEILNLKFQVSIDPDLEIQQNATDEVPSLPSVELANEKKRGSGSAIPRKKQLLYLNTKGLIGFGGIHYYFEDPDTRYFTSYFVEFNTKGLGLDMSLSLANWRADVFTHIENVFYWGSIGFKQSKGTPPICTKNRWGKQECTNLNGYQPQFNREIKPKNRYSVGISAGYAIHVFRRIDLVPYVNMGLMHYFNDVFIPNRAYRDVNYKFGYFPIYGSGLGLEYSVADNGVFFITGGYQKMQFNPRGYFDEVENLATGHHQWNITLGYRFAVL